MTPFAYVPCLCASLLLALSASLANAAPAEGADVEGLVNVALPEMGTRIVADTMYDQGYPGANVADGQIGRGAPCWFSRDYSPLPCAVTFEFSEAHEVDRVVLHQASWNGSMYHTKLFALEASDDGEQWRRMAEGELPDENEARVEVALEPVKTRWLRVVVLSSYIEQQTCGLAEVEILAGGARFVSPISVDLDGREGVSVSDDVCGLSLVSGQSGPQLAVMAPERRVAAVVEGDERARLKFDVSSADAPVTVAAEFRVLDGGPVEVALQSGEDEAVHRVGAEEESLRLAILQGEERGVAITLRALGEPAPALVSGLRLESNGTERPIALRLADATPRTLPPAIMPALRPGTERLLVEWDWRLQDGIGTPRNPSDYANAVAMLIDRGERLLADLREASVELGDALGEWQSACEAWRELPPAERESAAGEDLWRRLHWAKRALALRNPFADTGPILFAKRVPSAFSHQLTQYYGRYARPGGGLFVLEEPGRSMACRPLTEGKLPVGSCLHPEVSYDGDRVLFAFCEADAPPEDSVAGHHGRYYHLYEIAADGSRLKQLTDGAFDDFAPRYLPDDHLVFVSTRRLGWHRCGSPGCENYTLATAEGDGSNPRSISYHETQEWDPAVLNDGRVVYTRWDYVDRHAVFYEQLWSVLPDGSNPIAFYGNNTLNPVGVWEPRAVPGSNRIMATAAAHHAMTAGSIILVDSAMGVDGLRPITRLTPDAPFPESENTLAPHWRAPLDDVPAYVTPEQERWPGHCYRSPYPLSETYFLAAYSFEGLIGEPHPNKANMFGLYLVDAFGNKELLYRDPNIASQWPTPLRRRFRPPSVSTPTDGREPGRARGAFIVQDINASSPRLPDEPIVALRVVQVLPKSTPGANNPRVGLANASPGKQVLGTVPVAEDGSAYFEAPAGVPLSFQALDARGRAVQVMRSLTYLQPGETLACVGCHEPRNEAPLAHAPLALRRPPSPITPGPDGSSPLSYPILVQPLLDRHCTSCHGADDPAGDVRLTGEPEGHFTASYNALTPHVSFPEWLGGLEFRELNSEPLAKPEFFGARGSALDRLL